MIILIVIHPGTWSQHPFVAGFCFFWDAALYDMYARTISFIQNVLCMEIHTELIHLTLTSSYEFSSMSSILNAF